MDDALLRGACDLGLGGLEGFHRLAVVAGSDRFLDLAQVGAHARAARFVDFGTGRNLAGGLLSRAGIGHTILWRPGLSRVGRANGRSFEMKSAAIGAAKLAGL